MYVGSLEFKVQRTNAFQVPLPLPHVFSQCHSHFCRIREGVTPSVSTCIPEGMAVPSVSSGSGSGSGSGHWLRFNDVSVDEFSLSDVAVEAECFGGTYKAKGNEGQSGFRDSL